MMALLLQSRLSALLIGSLLVGCDGGGPDDTARDAVTSFTAPLSGSGDSADFYVPDIAAGERERRTDTVPVVVFLQGALVDKAEYGSLARTLAMRGYAVVVPNHYQSLVGMPQLFTSQTVIDAVLADVSARDRDPASPLYGVADPDRMAVLGHSFGGVVALQAIGGLCAPPVCVGMYHRPTALRAAALYGAHLVDSKSGKLTPIDTSGVAVALFSGEQDGRADPAKSQLTYEGLAPPRAILTFPGLNHFALTNSAAPAGAIPDMPQRLPQDEGRASVATWMGRFLDAELRASPPALRAVYDSPGDDTVKITADRGTM